MIEEDALNEAKEKLKKLCSTGNVSLDSNLGGGIPWGSLVLVSGENSSGKSTLMQQFAMGAVEKDVEVTYVTTEQTIRGMLNNMKALSWEPQEYFLKDRFKIFPIITSKGKLTTDRKVLFGHLARLINNSTSRVIIIDTLDFFTDTLTLELFRKFFSTIRKILTPQKIYYFVFPSFFVKEKKIDRLASLFDIYFDIKLKIDEDSGEGIRIIDVKKFRTLGEVISEQIPITIDPAFGIRVSAISSA